MQTTSSVASHNLTWAWHSSAPACYPHYCYGVVRCDIKSHLCHGVVWWQFPPLSWSGCGLIIGPTFVTEWSDDKLYGHNIDKVYWGEVHKIMDCFGEMTWKQNCHSTVWVALLSWCCLDKGLISHWENIIVIVWSNHCLVWCCDQFCIFMPSLSSIFMSPASIWSPSGTPWSSWPCLAAMQTVKKDLWTTVSRLEYWSNSEVKLVCFLLGLV